MTSKIIPIFQNMVGKAVTIQKLEIYIFRCISWIMYRKKLKIIFIKIHKKFKFEEKSLSFLLLFFKQQLKFRDQILHNGSSS